MTQSHEMSQCYGGNDNRLVQWRVATSLQCVKNAISAKHSNVKPDKTRYACVYYLGWAWLQAAEIQLQWLNQMRDLFFPQAKKSSSKYFSGSMQAPPRTQGPSLGEPHICNLAALLYVLQLIFRQKEGKRIKTKWEKLKGWMQAEYFTSNKLPQKR